MGCGKRILITGGHSSVAAAAKKLLYENGYQNIACPDRTEVDLTDMAQVQAFFRSWQPDYVLHIAGRTATIKETSAMPWDVFRDNLLMEYHVLEAALETNVSKTIWLSSDSALPYSENGAVQREPDLFQGPLKKQLEPYAFAKLAGIKMCEYMNEQQGESRFISLIPCNIYGNTRKGLLYGLVADFVNAEREGREEISVWGKGCLQYRFIHSHDVASVMLFAMNHQMKYGQYIVAPEEAVGKAELAQLIADCVGYSGKIVFDGRDSITAPSNASPQRLLGEGWKPAVSLENGIKALVEQIIKETV